MNLVGEETFKSLRAGGGGWKFTRSYIRTQTVIILMSHDAHVIATTTSAKFLDGYYVNK